MNESQKKIFNMMVTQDSFDYGLVISQSKIHALFGLEIPEKAGFKEYQDVVLKELSIIGYMRTELIKVGKYLKKDGANYRVLLPSENNEQSNNMISSAKRKLTRAQNLIKNTPKEMVEFDETGVMTNMQSTINKMEKHSLLMG